MSADALKSSDLTSRVNPGHMTPYPETAGLDNGQPRVKACSHGQVSASLPRIEAERDDRINVGAGGKLIVPREDIADGIDEDEELELKKKIRKPRRREWIGVNHDAELVTTLLIHEPRPMELEYFFVEPDLRGPINDEMKHVRVFPFFSFTTESHALWIVKVTPENSWYESLQSLLSRPHDFFEKHAVRIFSAKDKYRVKYKPLPTRVTWLPQSTSELLGQALGPDHFITSATHPLYVELVEGEELD